MSYMIEIVVTAFAFGGILGAIIALHLSSSLKDTATDSADDSLMELKEAPVKIKNEPPR